MALFAKDGKMPVTKGGEVEYRGMPDIQPGSAWHEKEEVVFEPGLTITPFGHNAFESGLKDIGTVDAPVQKGIPNKLHAIAVCTFSKLPKPLAFWYDEHVHNKGVEWENDLLLQFVT